VLLTNLLAYGGQVWMLTITAPGADLLRWDGTTVEGSAAREWNRTAAARWRELHRWAYQATRRELGNDALRTLARVWQLQRRGVLHLHLVVGFDSAREIAAARYYVARLRERSREFGFGFIDARDRAGRTGKSTVMEPHRAASYLSRYLADSSQLTEAIKLAHRPRQLIWVSPTLKACTGVTMRRLRRARLLWWIRQRRSSIVTLAGTLPAWFRDPVELVAVQSLLQS
jgi:hypothetical protein